VDTGVPPTNGSFPIVCHPRNRSNSSVSLGWPFTDFQNRTKDTDATPFPITKSTKLPDCLISLGQLTSFPFRGKLACKPAFPPMTAGCRNKYVPGTDVEVRITP
jgi:hypothetical protein